MPQGDLTLRAANAQARVASVLDPAGEERPTWLGPTTRSAWQQ